MSLCKSVCISVCMSICKEVVITKIMLTQILYKFYVNLCISNSTKKLFVLLKQWCYAKIVLVIQSLNIKLIDIYSYNFFLVSTATKFAILYEPAVTNSLPQCCRDLQSPCLVYYTDLTSVLRLIWTTRGIDGEKGASEVYLTLQIMTMTKMLKNVYNTCSWNISPALGAQRFL